jgi:NAD(P)H-hydrate repair Nnr-like enzyme with NAD(P)H-hydrate dehydratase domain
MNFPKRPDSHKGLFGTVTVIGGASGMVGAALLAGRAALKMGAGCVHVGMLADNAPVVDVIQPELMLHSAADALRLPGVDVLAIGCGTGRDMAAQKLLHDVLNCDAALVLDADALNILALRPTCAPCCFRARPQRCSRRIPAKPRACLAAARTRSRLHAPAPHRNWPDACIAAWC